MGATKCGTWLIIFGTINLMSLAATVPKSTPDPLVSNWESLPSEDKENFLSYFLALGVSYQNSIKKLSYTSRTGDFKEVSIPDGLGLTEEQVTKFQEMNIPESSVQKLVEWASSEFDLGDEELMELAVQREWCRGEYCVHILPDVNGLCCPW